MSRETVLSPKSSLPWWIASHFTAIGVWLVFASPLWHHSSEQRCVDFGDSLLLDFLLPTLGVGVVAALWGLIYTWLAGGLVMRRERLVVWSCLAAPWLFAAFFAYVKIRMDLATPCGG
jgi:hypothetical protein